MKVVEVKIEDIKPYANNPRNNDEAVEYVANSIKEFGFKVPLVLDKNNEIVCGHTRYKASKELGLKKVPCVIAEDLSEDQIKAFRIADNKVGEIAEWDTFKLVEEIGSIDLNMEDFGFDLDDLDFEQNDIEFEEDEFEVETDDKPPKAKHGDIYQLGNHRLMCGDSTSPEDVSKLVGEEMMDLCVTDPPYNVNYGSINESHYGKQCN